jgi:hypothetical protein
LPGGIDGHPGGMYLMKRERGRALNQTLGCYVRVRMVLHYIDQAEKRQGKASSNTSIILLQSLQLGLPVTQGNIVRATCFGLRPAPVPTPSQERSRARRVYTCLLSDSAGHPRSSWTPSKQWQKGLSRRQACKCMTRLTGRAKRYFAGFAGSLACHITHNFESFKSSATSRAAQPYLMFFL